MMEQHSLHTGNNETFNHVFSTNFFIFIFYFFHDVYRNGLIIKSKKNLSKGCSIWICHMAIRNYSSTKGKIVFIIKRARYLSWLS